MSIIKQSKTLLKRFKSITRATQTNLQGAKTRTKYVIIESDDWGAIRTPGKATLTKMAAKGVNLQKSVYKYDALASVADLDALFNVLQQYTDSKGRCAKITANTIVANPDFNRIRANDFSAYYYEPFTTTLKNYPEHSKSFSKWIQAIDHGLFKPQFHGREHLNINRWLQKLKSGEDLARFCFDLGMTYSGVGDYSFMEAYDWDTKADITLQNKVISEGINLFEELFGYRPASFIAPCYNWDPELEENLAKSGIKTIQGIKSQLVPTGIFNEYSPLKHYFGEMNNQGLHYTIRNCFLEPSLNPQKDWVDSCLAQVKSAFNWHKPAIICSHRINYIGYIEPKNRDRGLKDLALLLSTIIKKWPDVEFITTDELITKMAWE